jgi:hypothetical protein
MSVFRTGPLILGRLKLVSASVSGMWDVHLKLVANFPRLLREPKFRWTYVLLSLAFYANLCNAVDAGEW